MDDTTGEAGALTREAALQLPILSGLGDPCLHEVHTMVRAFGIGTWQAFEVYRCDTCGALSRALCDDDGFAEEEGGW